MTACNDNLYVVFLLSAHRNSLHRDVSHCGSDKIATLNAYYKDGKNAFLMSVRLNKDN